MRRYRNHIGSLVLALLTHLAAAVTVLVLGFLVGYVLIRGVPNLNADMFSLAYTSDNQSMLPAILNTCTMTLLALLAAVPFGIASAIYLAEYAKKGSKIVALIRVFHVLTKAADDEETEQDSVDWGASYDRSGRTYADADCTVTDDAEIEDAWQKTESSASRARREAQPAENTQTDSADDEVSEVIREGRAAMRRIRHANDLIPDPELSAQIDSIENSCGIPTGLTQNVKDLLASREIENIFENSDFIYMLSQAAGDRQILARQLGISEHQLSYVKQANAGEGLLFYGNIILPFSDKFPQNTELYRIMTTRWADTPA